MSKKLNLRTLLALIAIPPILLLAFIAAFGASVTFLGSPDLDGLRNGVQVLSLVAVAGMLLSVGMVLVVGRRVLEPINEVSEAAKELADVRLPMLIESLSNPGVSMPEFEPLAVSGDTELAQLGDALNSLQARAVTVANEQQRVVKEGISELVVNLARRNQSLLDRQIENIDNLESTEEDPDRLENLFRLDHLATRMRRNAESLLVLAGAEPSRRRGGPVVIADVIRVAMSEIEDYQHVSMGEIKTAHIGPQGAVDVAHLMSELLENATQFSPPDAAVEVVGGFDPNGFYEVMVRDHGIGMSAEQISAANNTIQNPPELGLALTRSLGFQVIGRLAERLGVTVELSHTEGGGTSAFVKIPGTVLSSGAAANVPAAFQSTAGGGASPRISQPPAQAAPAPMPQAFESAPQPAPAPMPQAFESAPQPAQAPSFERRAPAPEEVWSSPPAPAPRSEPTPPQQVPAAFQQPAPAPAQPVSRSVAPPEPQWASEANPLQAQPQQPEDLWANEPAPAAAPVDDFWANEPDPQPQRAPQPAPVPETFGQSRPLAAEPQMRAQEEHAPQPQRAPEPSPAPQQGGMPEAAGWATPAVPQTDAPAPSMEHAMPTGEAFQQGVDALLDDPSNRTNSGLVRRDRSQNHAPANEGRSIPAGGAAATASSRSPEEIRNMLARYRDGLKSNPDAGHGPN